jgi:transposase
MRPHPTRYPTDLSDEEQGQIKSLVPAPKWGKGKRGRPVLLDQRSLLNAIFLGGQSWLRLSAVAE